MKEQQELLAAQQRKEEMEALWTSQQQKLRNPNLQVSDQISKQVILEEQDESSQFELLDEETAVTQDMGFEKDLDLNEMNFNIIKNSNAFKPKSGFVDEDEI